MAPVNEQISGRNTKTEASPEINDLHYSGYVHILFTVYDFTMYWTNTHTN